MDETNVAMENKNLIREILVEAMKMAHTIKKQNYSPNNG